MTRILVWSLTLLLSACAAFLSSSTNSLSASENADALTQLKRVVDGMPAGSWYELPNSSIKTVLATRAEAPDDGGVTGPISVINAWNGAAFDGVRWYFHGGGHQDYSGNEIYAFDFSNLKWARVTEPSKLKARTADAPCPDTTDGTPLASHTYDGFLYVPTTKSIWLWPGIQYCRGGLRGRDAVWEFDLATKKWKKHARDPLRGFLLSSFDPKTARVILFGTGNTQWFDPRTEKYFGQSPYAGDMGTGVGVVDPDRRYFWGLVDFAFFKSRMGDAEMGPIEIATKKEDLPPEVSSRSGLAYDSKRRRIIAWPGSREIWAYRPDEERWVTFSTTTGPGPRLDNTMAGIYSKWIYIPEVDVFAGYANIAEGVWLYKPTDVKPTEIPRDMAKPAPGKKTVCTIESYDTTCNYLRLCQALNGAQDGDVITIRKGIYPEGCAITRNRLTIRAEPGAHLTRVAYGGKGNLVIEGNDTTIEGLECSEGYAEGNGACVRIEGHNVTLRRMHIHHEQMGILSGGPNGRIVIEDSVIEDIGAPNSDLSHGIYISESPKGVADELVVKRSVIRRSLYLGHLVKSRALRTTIEDSVLAGLDAGNSREIDIPQGGIVRIRRNVIQKGPKSDNDDLIGIALEPKSGIRKENDTLIEQNWIIVDRTESLLLTNRSPGTVRLVNNWIVGLDRHSASADANRKVPANIGQNVEARDNTFYATRREAGLQPYPALPTPKK